MPAPVVIVLHGTGGSKEGMAGRLRELAVPRVRRPWRSTAAITATRARPARTGMPAYQSAILRAYRTGGEHPFLFDTVWDVMRLIDYLETRDDVDARRIGLTGISKGGMETYLAAAVDPRIAVAVPLIGVQSFRWALDHGAWDSRAWTLREARRSRRPPMQGRRRRRVHAEVLRPRGAWPARRVRRPRDAAAHRAAAAARHQRRLGSAHAGGGRSRVRRRGGDRHTKRRASRERLVLHLQPDTGHQVTRGGRPGSHELVRALVEAVVTSTANCQLPTANCQDNFFEGVPLALGVGGPELTRVTRSSRAIIS